MYESEIDVLESMLPHPYRLPLAYKEFLLYGGHRMGELTSAAELDYGGAEIQLRDGYNEFFLRILSNNCNARLPSDIFLIMEHLGEHYKFFLLTEGEDPPVYYWNKREDGKGGLWDCPKSDSFSGYLKGQLRLATGYELKFPWKDIIEAGKPPRGKRFWVPIDRDFKEGITRNDLIGQKQD